MILFFLAGVLVLIIFIPGFAKIQELKAKNRHVQNEISKVEQENLALKQEIDKLKNDSVYLEGVAREKMGVVRKGEVIYRIVPETE